MSRWNYETRRFLCATYQQDVLRLFDERLSDGVDDGVVLHGRGVDLTIGSAQQVGAKDRCKVGGTHLVDGLFVGDTRQELQQDLGDGIVDLGQLGEYGCDAIRIVAS